MRTLVSTLTPPARPPAPWRSRWLTVGGMAAIAALVLCLPVVTGWVGGAFEVAKAPEQIRALQTNQMQLQLDLTAFKAGTDAKLQAIQESQERIERALHIQRAPKEQTP